MPKKLLRSGLLSRRRELSPHEVAQLSFALQRHFLALPEYDRARVLALYSPIHHEVETGAVAAAALAEGRIVVYPAVEGDRMLFRRISTLEELIPGRFGILEPAGEAFEPAAIDLFVVPGVGFDRSGRRIGYGKGFYDRALHRLEGSGRLVGFCYEFQLLEEIVGEPHDVTMDLVVTESGAVRVNNTYRRYPQ